MANENSAPVRICMQLSGLQPAGLECDLNVTLSATSGKASE